MLSKNTTKAISSDSQRAAFARWLPSASTSPPPMMGSQINRLRRGKFDTCSCSVARSEEHTSELQSLMRISYAVFCLKKKKTHITCMTEKHHIKPQTTTTTT